MNIPVDYGAIFSVSPSAKLLMMANPPLYTILDANNAYLQATATTREQLVGKNLFEAFPPNPQDMASKERTSYSFEQALATRRTHLLKEYRYDVPVPGSDAYEECYWTTTNTPVLAATGEILYLIHSPANVTADVKLKQELQLAEERARLAIESNDLGTFDIDMLTGEAVTSKRFAEIFGTGEDASRKEFVQLIHPDDMHIRQKAYEEALHTGRLSYEVRIIRPDKKIRWIKAQGRMFIGANGKPYRITGMVQDSTAGHDAGDQEQKLITLVDNSLELMSVLELDGTNSYLNRAGMAMLGFDTREQVRNTPIAELHEPEDFKQVEKEVLPAVMTHGSWSGTMMVRNLKTKEVFPVMNHAIRIDDPVRGVPIAVGAVMRDLRPELQAKQALEKSEELLRTITAASPSGLWKTNAAGEIEYVNQTWLDWTGSTFEDNRRNWERYIVEEDRQKTLAAFERSTQTGADYEAEFRLLNADGSVRWCLASANARYDQSGVFTGMVGTCVDVTEQKRLQRQKDDFLAIASHELKTPVTTIKAFVQMIEQMLGEKGLATEAGFATRADKQVDKLIGLVNDLLDVTKINTGKLQFNNAVFDLDELVDQVTADLQYTISSHQLVKQLGGSGKVLGDRHRMEQVLINLLNNAVKYSPGAKQVIVSSAVKDNEFHIEVTDFGAGIPEEDLAKVFDQFYRVNHAVNSNVPGLGLGLFISAEIVKRQNGKISAKSAKGMGSTFTVTLPLHREN